MKLLLILIMLITTLVIAAVGLVWYLSYTMELSR